MMAKRRRNGGAHASKTSYDRKDHSTNYGNSERDNKRDKENISEERSVSDTHTDRACNDPEWYSRDPHLLAAAGSLPFAEPFGAKFPWPDRGSLAGLPIFNNNTSLGTPGIMTLRVKPSIGFNVDRNSPINVAAQAFYTHVRYVNSGRKNYDPADLMMYALAVADLYSYIMWLERMYSCAFMYSQRNYYIGKNLLDAMGVDADDLVSNLANFRYVINVFINKISSFAVPSDIAIFKRRAFMYSSFYTESTEGSIKDQVYFFVPDGFYKFKLDKTSKGMLEYNKLNYSTKYKVSDLVTLGNMLLENIFGDEDFGLMAGDIIKAYGSNIIGLSSMPEELYILPVFDKYVLSQFQNATLIPDVSSTILRDDDPSDVKDANNYLPPENGEFYVEYGSIYQNNVGDIQSREAMVGSGDNKLCVQIHSELDLPLNVNSVTPDANDVIEATRLMSYVSDTDASGSLVITCGTEIVVAAQYYALSYMPDGSRYMANVLTETSVTKGDVSVARVARYAGAFTYHPNYISVDVAEDNSGLGFLRLIQNVQNLTFTNHEQLNRLHEVALLSLFYVPGIAKVANL